MDKYHFIGIGGIGMSALARVLKAQGVHVSGSDQNPAATTALQTEGIEITDQIPSSATVVYSTAIKPDHPQLLLAKQNNAILHRAELLAKLIQSQKLLAVAGTHGKTTTSALLTWVLTQANRSPSFAIGGLIPTLGNGGGGKDYFVAEADESDGSFLKLHPFAAIITNGDPDHLDYWKTPSALTNAYAEFASRPKHLIHHTSLSFDGNSYGFEPCKYQLTNFKQHQDHFTFDLPDHPAIQVRGIGKHNALNATAAFILCLLLNIPEDSIRAGLKTFPGVARRQQIIGLNNDVLIIDDYAHHPIEIEQTLQAIKAAHPHRRLIALCQPHRYTRVEAHFDAFSRAFDLADQTYITDIYSAGETPIDGLAQRLATAANAHYLPNPSEIYSGGLRVGKEGRKSRSGCKADDEPGSVEPGEEDNAADGDEFFVKNFPKSDGLSMSLQPHDLIVTLGAGDITHFAKELLHAPVQKLNLTVLCGGPSIEHDISIASARAIIDNLDPKLYNVKPLYMSKNSSWSHLDGDPIDLLKELQSCDCAVPIFHGPSGEDGMIQGLLETLNIPFIGCDFRSSAVCMDKVWTKQILQAHNIPIAPFTSFFAHEWKANPQTVLDRIHLTYPIWVKSAHLGSSFGMLKVDRPQDLPSAIDELIPCDTRFIVETHTPGRELEVAVLGNENPLITEPGEILTTGFYDFSKKYDDATQTTPLADLPPAIAHDAKTIAATAFQALACRGWARIDFLYSDRLYFSEINPIPGCTPTSLYPQMCAQSGIPYPELLKQLIRLALHA